MDVARRFNVNAPIVHTILIVLGSILYLMAGMLFTAAAMMLVGWM